MENNPKAQIVLADSKLTGENIESIRGKRVLVIEDGPTLTHGEMTYGAGVIAAGRFGAMRLMDPRPYLTGSLRATFEKYPSIGPLLPAMGYGKTQIRELEKTINQVPCDVVLIATPVDLTRLISINKKCVRIRYEYKDRGSPTLEEKILSLFDEDKKKEHKGL